VVNEGASKQGDLHSLADRNTEDRKTFHLAAEEGNQVQKFLKYRLTSGGVTGFDGSYQVMMGRVGADIRHIFYDNVDHVVHMVLVSYHLPISCGSEPCLLTERIPLLLSTVIVCLGCQTLH
jgi:hypothetical protein